ncbi:glycine--tRNA ligase-like [Sycon ciliatum]|uniref:glycine--tRNA ligase-like n=1 Tax=Sycon ciliatum TaxID=27933 RepID=UPI0031F6C0E1
MAFKDPLLNAVSNLARRRGFIFPTSHHYGGVEGRYEYGPLGTLLKQNIAKEWWRATVTDKENGFAIDSSVVQHPQVWETSGHSKVFGDRWTRDLLTGEQFKLTKGEKVKHLQSDLVIKAPSKKEAQKWRNIIKQELAPNARTFTQGTDITMRVESVTDSHIILAGNDGPVHVVHHGYLAPGSRSPFLHEPRMQGGLSYCGDTSPEEMAEDFVKIVEDNSGASRATLKQLFTDKYKERNRPLRPELAQAAFQQLNFVCNSIDKRFPFSLAQIGKAFRNELSCGPFIYRLKEFEQMECYHFLETENSERHALDLSIDRLSWWRSLARKRSNFKSVELDKDDLAHYATNAVDIEYEFPWGSEEVESIANRTDYDIRAHGEAYDNTFHHHDGTRSFVPHCVESSAGLDRAVMAYLCDAYDQRNAASDTTRTVRPVLSLHKRIAPVKVAVFPIVHNKPELVQIARVLAKEFRAAGLYTMYSEVNSIGKRYVDHDEMGTPYCITIDSDTIEKGTVTVRSRNTMVQEPMLVTDVVGALVTFYSRDDLSAS